MAQALSPADLTTHAAWAFPEHVPPLFRQPGRAQPLSLLESTQMPRLTWTRPPSTHESRA